MGQLRSIDVCDSETEQVIDPFGRDVLRVHFPKFSTIEHPTVSFVAEAWRHTHTVAE